MISICRRSSSQIDLMMDCSQLGQKRFKLFIRSDTWILSCDKSRDKLRAMRHVFDQSTLNKERVIKDRQNVSISRQDNPIFIIPWIGMDIKAGTSNF